MFECKVLSSLEKVFSCAEPAGREVRLSVLKGETASFQLAVRACGNVKIEAEAPGFSVRIRRVVDVPVRLPCWPGNTDRDYLSDKPGLYPDVLRDIPADGKCRVSGWWTSFWIDAEPEENLAGGDYSVAVRASELLDGDETGEVFEKSLPVHVADCRLPKQTLIHTEWFHCDCLADYYRVEAFGEEHWRIIENFIRSAVRMGINMILTPMFTPALDTEVGGERTTVQLVGVSRNGGVYSFDFSKLKKWIDLCLECGIEYFEMCHLYSQWGAKHAPKIMATVDGEYRRIFGWETDALGEDYREFLSCFLPALAGALKEWGVEKRCRFHISDEPHGDQLPHYIAVRDQAREYLPGFEFMDALSQYDFYAGGAVDRPVVSSDSGDLPRFIENKVPDLWIYYCCGQAVDVSNRFIAMPSQRTRMLGVQLYVYGFAGFLQWGFNFYNTQLSKKHIDPYAVTDAGESFPAGDAFIVYPADNGTAEESIRYMVMRQAAHDLRALCLLEELGGREFVLGLIADEAGEEITLSKYPRNEEFLPRLRARVNAEIEARRALK
ncbi:MAG: DUF4091 domain-containing protein [Clostridiales bacterium]|nr:DUF4091 domain-containing protein [Clostridiales bacterium]